MDMESQIQWVRKLDSLVAVSYTNLRCLFLLNHSNGLILFSRCYRLSHTFVKLNKFIMFYLYVFLCWFLFFTYSEIGYKSCNYRINYIFITMAPRHQNSVTLCVYDQAEIKLVVIWIVLYIVHGLVSSMVFDVHESIINFFYF